MVQDGNYGTPTDVTGGRWWNRLEQSRFFTENHVSCVHGMKEDGIFRPSRGNREVMGGRWRNKMEYLWIFMESHSTCENEINQDGRFWEPHGIWWICY